MWGQEHPCDPTAAGRGGQGEGIMLPLDTAQQLLGKHPHPEKGELQAGSLSLCLPSCSGVLCS